MSFQWLDMRISEEQDRRKREAEILERLPHALEEVHEALTGCIESYTAAFGAESAEMTLQPTRIQVCIREENNDAWQQRSKVNVSTVPTVPGFEIDGGSAAPLVVEVGLLPGQKVYYRDREQDKYLGMEELTRRILDRAFFPKLAE